MALFTNAPEKFESGIDGAAQQEWYGKATLDGTRGPWATAPVGSRYLQKATTTLARLYQRVKAGHAVLGPRTDDWAEGLAMISQTVRVADFTDGGSTIGTIDLTQTIPVGAWVQRVVLVNVTGFAGDTSATLQVGDGTTVARYSTGTPSIFTTAAAIDMGAVSGTAVHVAAATVRLTVTTAADFTAAVTNGTGQLTIRIYYLG